MKVLSFEELPEDQDARVNFPLKDETITGTPNCALVKIQTPLTGFAFESTYKVPAKIQYETAECWVYWPVRTTSFTIKHQQMGILNVNCPHALKPSTVYRLVLQSNVTVDDGLHAQWVVIKVVDPPTASIYIDGVFEGTGEVAKKLRPDTYKYRIEAPLYHFDEHRFTVDKEKVEMIEIKMLPNYGFIAINTTPENGAKVFIDGMEKGITPYTSDKIKSGTHTVKLLLNQYQPYETGLTVKDNTTTQESYALQPNFSEITLLSQGASLYVNGEQKGTDRWSGRLTSGIYTIEARKPSHAPAKQEIEVIAATPQSYTLTPEAQYGNLDIMTTPIGATITLDGAHRGTTPHTLTQILVGSHTLQVTKEGYGTTTEQIEIAENKTTEKKITLSTEREITINCDNDYDLYMDGRFLTHNTFTGKINMGAHTFELRENGTTIDTQNTTITTATPSPLRIISKTGIFNLSLTPQNAYATINGKVYQNKSKHFIEKGVYQVAITAPQYETLRETITIGDSPLTFTNKLRSTREVDIVMGLSGFYTQLDLINGYQITGGGAYTGGLSVSLGYQFNRYFKLGAGVGCSYIGSIQSYNVMKYNLQTKQGTAVLYSKQGGIAIPLYLQIGGLLSENYTAFYWGIDLGVRGLLPLVEDNWAGSWVGLYLAPTIGIAIDQWRIGLSYEFTPRGHQYNNNWSITTATSYVDTHSVALKIGYQF